MSYSYGKNGEPPDPNKGDHLSLAERLWDGKLAWWIPATEKNLVGIKKPMELGKGSAIWWQAGLRSDWLGVIAGGGRGREEIGQLLPFS